LADAAGGNGFEFCLERSLLFLNREVRMNHLFASLMGG
jgi:hypothetical protein